ncbi:unnamed protein product [Pleuronectes platessa]|uniref:Uncharacterized protein n=1 Tax=Pleuronectes platessa TaxID=8262 RepID=A0A9N7Z7Y9_PLEPL|nr:unnamed protein product [Pleuronectes platessa]
MAISMACPGRSCVLGFFLVTEKQSRCLDLEKKRDGLVFQMGRLSCHVKVETALYVGVIPRKGSPGKPGDQGPQGPMGPWGLRGPPGDKGRRGIEGSHGPEGPKGDRGHPGAGGEPGLSGLDGCNGTMGRPGVPGTRGLDGLNGPPGLPGLKGVKGEPLYGVTLPGLPVSSSTQEKGSVAEMESRVYLEDEESWDLKAMMASLVFLDLRETLVDHWQVIKEKMETEVFLDHVEHKALWGIQETLTDKDIKESKESLDFLDFRVFLVFLV